MFIDLSKAFNSIDHTVLLTKFSAYDFDETALQWFVDYLSCRQQCVVLNDSLSD